MKAMRRCAACGQSFLPRPQVPKQCYCSDAACQRERRRRWQKQRMRGDPDYRDNQARARSSWLMHHKDYWSHYRTAHPAYVERNRTLQRSRNLRRRSIAKMDVSCARSPLPSGIYTLQRQTSAGIAKMDAWTVEIVVLPRGGPLLPMIAKR
nr:hypothetical protein [Cupriavidus sp. UYPR2.512]